jgi:hypothetical protein
MVTRKFNRKTREIDFYVNGTYVRSADPGREAEALEAELTAKALKFAALHAA